MPDEPLPLVVERRRDDLVGVTSAKACLFSALGLTVLMVFVFLALVITRPEILDTKPVRYMAMFLAAIIVGLFAGAGINITNVLNGHQAMLIRVVAEKERAKGVIEGLEKNPNVNISPP